jgi:8-oxo-dGTP pyrophosphatase MutT (NUDIX family)
MTIAPATPAAGFERLADLYEGAATVVRREGRAYPAAVEPSPVTAIAVAERPAPVDPGLSAAGAAHLAAIRAGRRVHDGPVAVLDGVAADRVTAAIGSYFEMIATCDSLAAEYAAASGSLPLRDRAHLVAGGNPLHDGRGRAAAIGVSVAAVVRTRRGRGLVLGRRRADLAVEPGRWHVLPSGIVEEWDDDPVLDTLARELREEIGVDFGSEAELRARLTPLGLGHDLPRLRPDVCFRLDLEDFPVADLAADRDELDAIEVVELSRAGLRDFWRDHPPSALTPPAAATVALLEASV